jgi:hypothetical protein
MANPHPTRSRFSGGKRLPSRKARSTRALLIWLVLINFIGDEDIKGPSSAEEWKAAYRIVWHVMGLPRALPPP